MSLWDNQISNISPLSSLTSLTDLELGRNQISNISSLSSLTSLKWLSLSTNQISDIKPLVDNPGIDGRAIHLEDNPLSCTSIYTYIPQLEARHVNVYYDAPVPDTTPPDTSITDGPSGVIEYNDVTFTWTGTDDSAPTPSLVYSYKLEGYEESWSSPYTSDTSKDYNDLPNGPYTFMVRAKDCLDTVDPIPAESSFMVDVDVPDTTPPNTTITVYPSGTIAYNDVSFSWTGTDDCTPTSSLIYSYKLEGYEDSWSDPYASDTSKLYSDLPDGPYTFMVRARDGACNDDPSPDTKSFTVDVDIPDNPQLYVSTNSIDFGAYSTSEPFTIQNSGGGTLTWETSDNQPWLGVSPPSDSTTTETDTVTVTVGRSGLPEGPHYGTITVSSNGGTEYISIEMRVPGTEYGTTIITHGFRAGLPATRPAWTLTMAEEILKQADEGSIWIYTYNGDDNGHFSPYAVSPNDGEIVLLFDWADQSNNFTRGYSEAAGDALFAALLMGESKGDWYLDHLHFIGHSRGTVVNSEVVERLLKRAETLGEPLPDIHVTNLDPHDWGVAGYFCSDYDVNPTLHEQGVVMWDGTTWADTYYQDGGILTGQMVQGTCNSYLGEIGHSGVHEWYVDTIMSPDAIWPPATEKSGYYYSRLEGGLEHRPSPTGTPTPTQFEWFADGIVNGDFERGPTGLGVWKLPGWSQHGGGGSGHIDYGYLELDFGETAEKGYFLTPSLDGKSNFLSTT